MVDSVSIGQTGMALVIKPSEHDNFFDQNGETVPATWIPITNKAGVSLNAETRTVAYYESESQEYWALTGQQGGGSGTVATEVLTDVSCSGSSIVVESNYLWFNSVGNFVGVGDITGPD